MSVAVCRAAASSTTSRAEGRSHRSLIRLDHEKIPPSPFWLTRWPCLGRYWSQQQREETTQRTRRGGDSWERGKGPAVDSRQATCRVLHPRCLHQTSAT